MQGCLSVVTDVDTNQVDPDGQASHPQLVIATMRLRHAKIQTEDWEECETQIGPAKSIRIARADRTAQPVERGATRRLAPHRRPLYRTLKSGQRSARDGDGRLTVPPRIPVDCPCDNSRIPDRRVAQALHLAARPHAPVRIAEFEVLKPFEPAADPPPATPSGSGWSQHSDACRYRTRCGGSAGDR